MRLQLSIPRLMALILFAAMSLAAAMAGALTFAVVTLSAATLCAVVRRGPSRAFLVGGSLSGWAFMLLAFGVSRDVRMSLPTIHPIIGTYEAIYGPGPMVFKTEAEAQRWVIQLVADVDWAITTGHSLIALACALVGGTITWLIVLRWRGESNRGEPHDLNVGPVA